MTLLLRFIPNGYHVLPRGQPIAQDIAKGSREEAPQLQQIPQTCAYRTRYGILVSHAVNNLFTELSLDRYAALPGAVQLEGDPRGAGLPSRCLREVPAPGRPPGPVQAQSPRRAETVRRGAPNQRCASALCMGQPLTAVCPARTRFIVFSSLSPSRRTPCISILVHRFHLRVCSFVRWFLHSVVVLYNCIAASTLPCTCVPRFFAYIHPSLFLCALHLRLWGAHGHTSPPASTPQCRQDSRNPAFTGLTLFFDHPRRYTSISLGPRASPRLFPRSPHTIFAHLIPHLILSCSVHLTLIPICSVSVCTLFYTHIPPAPLRDAASGAPGGRGRMAGKRLLHLMYSRSS